MSADLCGGHCCRQLEAVVRLGKLGLDWCEVEQVAAGWECCGMVCMHSMCSADCTWS